MNKSSFSLIDLSALSEPVTKLIESVSNAIGVLYEPTRIRRKAKADSDALIIQAKGNIEAHELAARATRRLNEVEIRRQRNIESIVRISADQLPKEVSKEPVNQDWIAYFFDFCKDVGDKEMQSIWARLLAGEVAKPGKFSLRTLSTVRMLLPGEAMLFEHCTRYFSRGHNLYYSFVADYLRETRRLPERAFIHLHDIGLLSVKFTNTIGIGETKKIVYFNKQFTVTHPFVEGKLDIGTVYGYYTLTSIGEELYTLCNPKPDNKFFKALYQGIKQAGDLKVSRVTRAS